jgi:NAD(P)-dependent dehydrogenase (short-subunit alcohol dehydrogenase family)
MSLILAIERAAAQIVASGGTDVVFHNAGYGLAGALEALKDDQIVRLVNTNMLGTIRTTKAFIPQFRETVYQHNFAWRVSGVSVQLHLPRYQVGG